jgi:hypothetical protein
MTIHVRENLYPGVNAHLNSFLQQEGGGWESFHARLIADIQTYLFENLPPPYFALPERSLQISAMPLDSDAPLHRLRPDVTILRTRSLPQTSFTAPSTIVAPRLVIPLADTLEITEDRVTAVMVYHTRAGQYPGEPVTRIEVLSPANKPPGSDFRHYRSHRLEPLRAGLRLVEIDLLHEQRPLITQLPSYVDADDEALPYTIAISKPAPPQLSGKLELYGAAVLEPLPFVPIPLKGDDFIHLDMQAIYNRSYLYLSSGTLIVDYETEPARFDRYKSEDQAQIRAFLADVRSRFAHAAQGDVS